VPIIRRNDCIYATFGTCYSVRMTVWYAGYTLHATYPYRVTNTKCRVDTVTSSDGGHIVARNMQRKEANILRKIVHQVGFIYKIRSYIFFPLIMRAQPCFELARDFKSPTRMFRELYNSNYIRNISVYFEKRVFRCAVTSCMGRLSPLLSLDELKEKLKLFSK